MIAFPSPFIVVVWWFFAFFSPKIIQNLISISFVMLKKTSLIASYNFLYLEVNVLLCALLYFIHTKY